MTSFWLRNPVRCYLRVPLQGQQQATLSFPLTAQLLRYCIVLGKMTTRLAVLLVVMLTVLANGANIWLLQPAAAYSDNCNGSGLCGCCVSQNDCRTAIGRYSDGTTYSGYTSRVSNHCAAIFRCDGAYPSLSGATLKQLFLHVYQNQPCQKCGSHAFNGNCEATLNYCGSCSDSGNPN